MYSIINIRKVTNIFPSKSFSNSKSFNPSLFTSVYHRNLATATKTKKTLNFVCENCGHTPAKWYGQCPSCKSHETIKEFRVSNLSTPVANSRNISPSLYRQTSEGKEFSSSSTSSIPSAKDNILTLRKNINLGWLNTHSSSSTESLSSPDINNNNNHLSSLLVPISSIKDSVKSRLIFGSNEIDTLFGGGLTKGSVTLVSGPPGVGKSTLLLQLAVLLCRGEREGIPYSNFFQQTIPSKKSETNSPISPNLVAYISGEEAAGQLRSRTNRLKVEAPGLLVLNETRMESIIEQLDTTLQITKESSTNNKSLPPLAAVIIDSIQTMFTDASSSLAGSPAQVRECTTRLISWAKATNIPIILVGHVTKQGDIAGPRVLEHMVDTVMMIEGEENMSNIMESNYNNSSYTHQTHRIIRSIKNRFGSTNEVAILSMTNEGFVESTSSRMFLSHVPEEIEDSNNTASSYIHHRPNGCSVGITTEGSRALVVELQALITKSFNPYPRIRSMGIMNDRIHMLSAVLSAHAQATLRKLANQRIQMLSSSISPNITTKVYSSLSSSTKPQTNGSTRLPSLNMCDVLINIVGGLRISDPTTDAALVLAIASSYTSIPIPSYSLFIGEVGLGGELRKCINIDNRIKAAKLAGFQIIYIPKGSLPDINNKGIKIIEVRNVHEMITVALQKSLDELLSNAQYTNINQSYDENIDEINNYSSNDNETKMNTRKPIIPSSSLDSSLDDDNDNIDEDQLSLSKDIPMNNNQQIMELLNRVRKRKEPSNSETNENIRIAHPLGADASEDIIDEEVDPQDRSEKERNFPERGPAGLDSTEDWDITNQEEEDKK